jgi:hypothetical protein
MLDCDIYRVTYWLFKDLMLFNWSSSSLSKSFNLSFGRRSLSNSARGKLFLDLL